MPSTISTPGVDGSPGLLPLFLPPALFLIEGAGFLPVILSGAKDLAILAEG